MSSVSPFDGVSLKAPKKKKSQDTSESKTSDTHFLWKILRTALIIAIILVLGFLVVTYLALQGQGKKVDDSVESFNTSMAEIHGFFSKPDVINTLTFLGDTTPGEQGISAQVSAGIANVTKDDDTPVFRNGATVEQASEVVAPYYALCDEKISKSLPPGNTDKGKKIIQDSQALCQKFSDDAFTMMNDVRQYNNSVGSSILGGLFTQKYPDIMA